MTTRIALSNRQYPMLQVFMDHGDHWYMSVSQACRYDQRPFRSMLVREWIHYVPGRGFYITKAGKEAWRAFHGTQITRRNPLLPLTSYIDPATYRQPVRLKVVPIISKTA